MIVNNGCGAPETPSCPVQLNQLYQDYLHLISGQQVSRVGSSDFRVVEYTAGNIKELVSHYNSLWDMCGANSGLPRLNAPGTAGNIRGGPALYGC